MSTAVSAPQTTAAKPAASIVEFFDAVNQATFEAIQILRAVMAHATTALAQGIADKPIPKALDRARLAANQVLRFYSRITLDQSRARRSPKSPPAKPAQAETAPEAPSNVAPAMPSAAASGPHIQDHQPSRKPQSSGILAAVSNLA